MTSSTPDLKVPAIQTLTIDSEMVTLVLEDGRFVSAPLNRFPRLLEGTPREREHWELIGSGFGVHWPDLDEDISVESLLLGRQSMESTRSLENWRASRRDTNKTT